MPPEIPVNSSGEPRGAAAPWMFLSCISLINLIQPNLTSHVNTPLHFPYSLRNTQRGNHGEESCVELHLSNRTRSLSPNVSVPRCLLFYFNWGEKKAVSHVICLNKAKLKGDISSHLSQKIWLVCSRYQLIDEPELLPHARYEEHKKICF